MNSATGIHTGANTHHHDQAITPVSFSVRKIKNRTLKNPSLISTATLSFPKICRRQKAVLRAARRFQGSKPCVLLLDDTAVALPQFPL